MKIFAFALVSLFALCKAEDHKIDGKLISPDFLFDVIYEYQDRLDELQDEINLSIKDVQSGFSSVIQSSTDSTLRQYNDHVTGVHGSYTSSVALFANVAAGQCRDDALESLAFQLRLSGNRKGNCARTFNDRVQTEINAANAALKNVDNFYNQVQSIAVKSFIAQNAFLDPEEIQNTILDIYDIVRERWEEARPELNTIRQNLSSRIAGHSNSLSTCLTTNSNTVNTVFSITAQMVDECNNFESNSGRKSKAANTPMDRMREINEKFENLPEFEWPAM